MRLVSFVLPAYKVRFLAEAVESILAQTYSNFELIVVDDASPEPIENVILNYSDPRIRYYRNPENLGSESLVNQWNHCLQYVRGEYMMMASDDDVYHPEFLKECLSLAGKYPQVNLIRVGAAQIDEHNGMIGIDGILPEKCSKYQFAYYWLNATVFTCIGNYLFKSAQIKEKLFIDFPCAFGSDTASAINMAENGVANAPEMLFSFRISSIHLSSNKGRLGEKLKANTMLFTWLKSLNYEEPEDPVDRVCFRKLQWSELYAKCRYDYYNLVIKHLPFGKIHWIWKCELLTAKDKWIMFARYLLKSLLPA